MPAIAIAIILASGWRRRLIAFAAGRPGGARHGAFQFFSGAHDPDDSRRLADRRMRGDPPKARRRAVSFGFAGFGVACLCGRLVVGLWLFHRRILVAWRGVSRRSRRIRLGLAAGGGRASLRPRGFPGSRLPAGAADVVAGCWPSLCPCRWIEFDRMAARACLNGISLEQFRHGARRQSSDRAIGLDCRPLRSDRHRHPYFFRSRGAW